MRDYNYRIEWSYLGEFGNRLYDHDIFFHYTSSSAAVKEVIDDYGEFPGFRIEQVHREESDGWYVVERHFWEDEE